MMTWLAWLVIALALLVIVLNLWMMWQRLSDAARRSADSDTQAHYLSEHQPEAEHAPPIVLGELDERGYIYCRKLLMGCEAAIWRTPSGAMIVAGKCGLREPQYAWDYTSVAQAHKALVHAKFRTDPKRGIVVNGSYPAAEPDNYFRRWKYTTEGRVERF